MAEKASAAKARKPRTMDAAMASVKTLTTADLIRIVIGRAAADAVTSRYATACIHSDHRPVS